VVNDWTDENLIDASAGDTPPTAPRAAVLPFGDPERDDRWFEDAVRELLRLHGFTDVAFYGTRGDTQDGIDLYGDRGDLHYGIQAKHRKVFTEGDTNEAIAAATYTADRFILALSRRAGVGVHRAIRRNRARWELWDQVRLSDLVRELPHDHAVDYIERFFHPAHVETFLGRSRATTFLEREIYFATFSDPASLRYHGWSRVGPAEPLEALQRFLADGTARVAIVSGPIGGGKSKLLYDATVGYAGALHPYFVAPQAVITPEALAEIRAQHSLVFVDDAGDVDHIESIIAFLRSRPQSKLVLTVAGASSAGVHDSLLELGYRSDEICTIALKRLGRAATIALVQQVLGAESPDVEEAVIRFASDTPLATILTTRVVRERHAGADAVHSEEAASDLVRALYRDVAIGKLSDEIDQAEVRAAMEVIAATGPAKLDDDTWLDLAAAFLGWDVPRLLRAIDAIDDAGVLLRRGFHYSLAPDILRQSVLLGACVARGRDTGFALRLYDYFPYDTSFLRNVALADIESQGEGGPPLFAPVWRAVEQHAASSNSLDRLQLLDHLEHVAYVKPNEVLHLCAYLVDHPAANDGTQPYAHIHVITHTAVLRELPHVLQAVMMGEPARIGQCVRLLWRLAAIEKPDNPHAADAPRAIKELAGYDIQFGTQMAEPILTAVTEMIRSGERDLERRSLLDLIEPALKRDVDDHMSRGTQLVIRRGIVPVSRVRDLRDRAIALVAETALGDDPGRTDKALKLLGDLLRDPWNLVRPPTEQEQAAWDRERAVALDTFDAIIAAERWPLRSLRILDLIPWFANHSSSALVRDRATAALAKLQGPSARDRYRILLSEYLRFDSFAEFDPADPNAGQQLIDEFTGKVSCEYLDSFPDPRELLADVGRHLAEIAETGSHGSAWRLFAALIWERYEYGVRMIDAILEDGDRRFYRDMGALLGTVILHEPAAGAAIADQMLALGDVDAAIGVAQSLGAVNAPPETIPVRARLLREVLRCDNLQVRLCAAHALIWFRDLARDAIPGLIADARIDNESKLADDLFMMLPKDVTTIAPSTRERLLEQLRHVANLEFWPLDYLRRLAPTNGAAVFDLFIWRITAGQLNREYHAVPLVDITFDAVMQALVAAPGRDAGVERLLALYPNLEPARRRAFDTLFGHLARAAPQITKTAIDVAFQSSDSQMHQAGLNWMRTLHHSLVTADVPFLVRSVESAFAVSQELGESLCGPVLNAITFGAEAVAVHEATPSDHRIQEVATAALVGELSPDARRFFETLLQHGRTSAERSIRLSEDAFGPL